MDRIFPVSMNLLGIHPGLSQLQSRWLLHVDSSGGIARAQVLL